MYFEFILCILFFANYVTVGNFLYKLFVLCCIAVLLFYFIYMKSSLTLTFVGDNVYTKLYSH